MDSSPGFVLYQTCPLYIHVGSSLLWSRESWLLERLNYLCCPPWFPIDLLTPNLVTEKDVKWSPKSHVLQQEKRKRKWQGKDRHSDACNICLVQTLMRVPVLENHQLALRCVVPKEKRAAVCRVLGENCSGTAWVFVFCWFSAKNVGLREMVIPESSFNPLPKRRWGK